MTMASSNTPIPVDDGFNEYESAVKRQKSTTSKVWDEMTKLECKNKNELKAQCNRCTHTCKEMEFNVCSSSAKKQSQSPSLPPRRGQVKMRILKTILKSVTSMASPKESVPHLSSTSTTAAPTPTGYLSD
ncbi:hypothetical protein ES288_D07G109700v1 [Gossypium darwinii]|uniref:Uncharacterized protein n=1 Tax=Gossypium darwinii TaxID=34276 RepID=A0A5D2BUF7_GOSDA|nr:hypothetical protein ES288_D07G109700v1 [Gossypium darwinii]